MFRNLRLVLLASILRIRLLYHLTNFLSSTRFMVEGHSMEPNLANGDYLLISRLEYKLHLLERGDVVVLIAPDQPNIHHVKRIVGLPGEKIRVQEGEISACKKSLDQPYDVKPRLISNQYEGHWFLGADDYFVVGDNKTHSRDSRQFGPIKRHCIVGKVWLRYWPRNRWGSIDS